MKTYKQWITESRKVIHTTTINLKTGGPGNFGLRVIFEVVHMNNKVFLHIIAAGADQFSAFAQKHYKIDGKTKVADIYKWAKAVAKEAMPRTREFNDMFQRMIDFWDPMNEAKDYKVDLGSMSANVKRWKDSDLQRLWAQGKDERTTPSHGQLLKQIRREMKRRGLSENIS